MPQPYPAPPIIDAIVELRLETEFNKRDQDRVVKSIKANYDRHEEVGEVDVQVEIKNGQIETQTGSPKPVHILSNHDQNNFCRIETSKLHWSRLPPYEGWVGLEDRISRDVGMLPKKIGFPRLERIGVRYRNRIDVPVGEDDLCRYEDYLSVHLGLPSLLNPHDGYKWTIEKDFRDRGVAATISSGLITSEIPDTIGILLDIDVYAIGKLADNWSDLLKKIRELRALKNEVFEVCVTDKARESFQ